MRKLFSHLDPRTLFLRARACLLLKTLQITLFHLRNTTHSLRLFHFLASSKAVFARKLAANHSTVVE